MKTGIIKSLIGVVPMLATVLFATSCLASVPKTIDLSGMWSVAGEGLEGTIALPGTLDGAGLGAEVDTLALSTNEQFRRLTRRHKYIGAAVYSREFDIPAEMAGLPLILRLERVVWKSSVRVDGVSLDGQETSLATPHTHLIENGLPQGRHKLEITVDNSPQFDISFDNLAHAYTNDTQVMWNGVLGEMSLTAIPPVAISDLRVFPTENLDSIRVVAVVDARGRQDATGLAVEIDGRSVKGLKLDLKEGANAVDVSIPAEGLGRWDEFNPELHKLTLVLPDDRHTVSFGLRTIDNRDGIRVNGSPVILRGTLECCVFPLTGTPPTSREGWLKTFSTAKEWGLNHLRFHSWCPPEAAFEVADSLGFYIQVELPVWSLKIGESNDVKDFMRSEFDRISREYGNHPSFCLMTCGNELQYDFEWLNDLTAYMKRSDPRRLYATTSFTFEKGHGGHPEPEDQFFVSQWTDDGWVRGQGVFENEHPCFNKDYSASMGCVGVPLVTHEIGQYSVYPAINEIGKYTGTLNPLNFKNIRKDLIEKNLIGEAMTMTLASGRLAAILYKEEIERARKTPGISGYQLLGLQDFPGQGTALVGLLDAFWDNKGAVEPAWFRQFSSPVVPLLSFASPTRRGGERFEAGVSVSNFGDKTIENVPLEWRLSNLASGETIAEGMVDSFSAPKGAVSEVGKLSFTLPDVENAASCELSLRLGDYGFNSWKLWIYPDEKLTEADYAEVVATSDPEEALKALGKGKNVLLAPSSGSIAGIESKFLPVFWSPVHFPKQAATMGLMCDPTHPALAHFPNEGHSDWQWWSLVHNTRVANIDSVAGATPIVKGIDNFVNNRRLAYLFEAQCGAGKLLFSCFDVLGEGNDWPEREGMLRSLLRYMNSPEFKPQGAISEEEVLRLSGR